jgi:hypothetical protein
MNQNADWHSPSTAYSAYRPARDPSPPDDLAARRLVPTGGSRR